jgi:neutral ceramidase
MLMKQITRASKAIAILCAAAAMGLAADLEIATATVDITAPVGYPMGGYGARKEVSKGVHDPIMAKVLLIRSGGRQLGIVTFDLVQIASPRIVREARETLGISTLLEISTHDHSGPVPKDRQNPESDPWYRGMEDKVLAALKQAQANYHPAELSIGQASIYLGHNRRKVNEDGTVTMFWRNADRVPTHPVDPHVGLLRFTGTDGKVLALMVNYACHAVVLGPENLEFSADWPGYMYRRLEQQLGNGAVAYFIPGAGGDINPYDDKMALTENAYALAQKTGEAMADAVLKGMAARPPKPQKIDLKVSQETYDFSDRFDPYARVPVEVTRLMFNNDAGVLAIPGEPFVRFQMNLRDQSPLANTFLFGYAYGGEGKWAGYLPTMEAAMQGGYGAGYSTHIQVGAGESIVDRAVVWFYEQLGKLRDTPDKP